VQARASRKSRRLTEAAVHVLHQQGVEKTTLADIARAADVPVGNVYYYFKTKDDLVRAALAEHSTYQDELLARLDDLADPRKRIESLVQEWISNREEAARRGCPTGTLAMELRKRPDDALSTEAAAVYRRMLDWITHQFREIGRPDPDQLAMTLVAHSEGMAMMSNIFSDPEIVTREGARLLHWLDEL
jgi:TetR/AcrR family transcriptional regulator, transcriptional repressor for nem operon